MLMLEGALPARCPVGSRFLLCFSLLSGEVTLVACGDPMEGPPNTTPADMRPGTPPDMTPVGNGADCPPELACEIIPAAYDISDPKTGAYGNYDLADRPNDGLDIRYIVIHDTDATYEETLKIFTDPANVATAHYVVRSEDGHVVEMVPPKNVAWHAGNWYFNAHSVGIEHTGFAAEGYRWYSEEMYQASAKLVRYLGKRYNIPLDRAHIFGHEEVPGTLAAKQKSMHWDPGPYWNWDHYMQLVQAGMNDEQADQGKAGPVVIRPKFSTNKPAMTYCFSPDESMTCGSEPSVAANFLYLRTMPDAMAPFIANPYLVWPGDRVFNWGDKAATGRSYHRAQRQGDWDQIEFGGEMVWMENPGMAATRSAQRMLVTPKAGLMSAPVYGVGYPGAAAFQPPTMPPTVEKIYDLPFGQHYVATGPFAADYYWARSYAKTLAESHHVVVKDDAKYYQIAFNHRYALVNASDMDVVMP